MTAIHWIRCKGCSEWCIASNDCGVFYHLCDCGTITSVPDCRDEFRASKLINRKKEKKVRIRKSIMKG